MAGFSLRFGPPSDGSTTARGIELLEAGAVYESGGSLITMPDGTQAFITPESFAVLLAAGEIDADGNVAASSPTGTTATATATMVPGGASVITRGSGYGSVSTLTLVGGTSTETATFTITGRSTVAGQDETSYTGGELTGTFTGGASYSVSDTVTLSDGSVITVDAVSVGAVTEFTVTSASTSGHSNFAVLTQSSTSGSGTGFSLTQDDSNQGVFSVLPVGTGDYSVLPASPSSVSHVGGSGATLSILWGVETIIVTDGGSGYTSAPAVSFSGGGGSAGTASLSGDAVASISVDAPGDFYTAIAVVTVADPPG